MASAARVVSFIGNKLKREKKPDRAAAMHNEFANFYAERRTAPASGRQSVTGVQISEAIIQQASPYAQSPHALEPRPSVNPPVRLNDFEGMAVEPNGAYLVIKDRYIDGDIDLEGENIPRPLRFINCTIRGKFWAKDAQFRLLSFYDCEMDELRLHRAAIAQSVIVQRCKIYDGVQMRGAKVGQSVSFKGSMVGSVYRPVAIDLANARIGHSLYMSTDSVDHWGGTINARPPATVGKAATFYVDGAIILAGVEVGGNIYFRGAQLNGKKIHHPTHNKNVLVAIEAFGLRCGSSVYLDHGFHSIGEVNFKRARVGLLFDCGFATFDNGGDALGDALNLRYASIGTDFIFCESKRIRGSIDLIAMETKSFHDDIESWNLEYIGEGKGYIRLNGLSYDRLVNIGDIKERCRWLAAQPPGEGSSKRAKHDFRAQPWTQLAMALEAAGNMRRAQEFRYVRDSIRRKTYSSQDTTGNRVLSFIWRWAFIEMHFLLNGFNHRPFRALFASLLLISICSIIFSRAYDTGLIKPSQPVVVLKLEENQQHNALIARNESEPDAKEAALGGQFADHSSSDNAPYNGNGYPKMIALEKLECPPKDYEPFSPLLFSLDVFLPILDFNQASNWQVRFERRDGEMSVKCWEETPKRRFNFPFSTQIQKGLSWVVMLAPNTLKKNVLSWLNETGLSRSWPTLINWLDTNLMHHTKSIAMFERAAGWILTTLATLAFAGFLRQNQ